ncbi:CHAT domain-containing protein [Geitlerinema calcuttense]|uniref:CHAT domain-containing protein n=1 Tax=Geitlerinema calcuttense TaxID=1471433 RepID=UPI00255BF1AD|nr:CHAT domain-containing protein [Geitlerinema calcuttense]
MELAWMYRYSIATLIGVSQTVAVSAQPILPALDGMQTQVIPNGNQIGISGGQLSRDGANLFHSFQQFNLLEGQTANFLSQPQIQNILGRINGGEPSLINGLIQVTGGLSNLYLMNPAGIVFGNAAQLNVPGSFLATTANGIGFGSQGWFNAIGPVDSQNLVGTPNQFAFSSLSPGAIANTGHLQVPDGQNLTLLGGTTLTLGTVEAPGGQITIAAIPGERLVRISQTGHLLNLEITPQPGTPLTPASLPELLTRSDIRHATGLRLNESGQLVLNGSSIPLSPATQITSGTVSASSTTEGGSVNLLGNYIGLFNATVSADGTTGGGTLRIGGEFQGREGLPTAQQTWVSRDSILSANTVSGSGGRAIVWSEGHTHFLGSLQAIGETGGFGEISGKESLVFRGQVDVTGTTGSMGTILFDPKNIIIANLSADTEAGSLIFSDFPNSDVTLSADGVASLTGNVILEAHNDITVGDRILSSSLDRLELNAGRSIILNADINLAGNNGELTLVANSPQANPRIRDAGPANITQAPGTILQSGNGDMTILMGDLGEVGTVRLAEIITSGGNITVETPGSIELTGSLVTAAETTQAGDIQLRSFLGKITTTPVPVIIASDSQQGRGGNISIEAFRDILVGQVVSQGEDASGNISILSLQGQIDTTASVENLCSDCANLDAFSLSGQGGKITLDAWGDITTGQIVSQGRTGSGDIEILSATGNITTTAIADSLPDSSNLHSVSDSGPGGSVRLEANQGRVTTGDIISESALGAGGDIQIQSEQHISVGNLVSTGWDVSGDITLFSLSGTIESGNAVSLSPEGRGGKIDLDASSGVQVGEILSQGKLSGGEVRVFSERGQILLNGQISSLSEGGTGGNILVDSFDGNIVTVGDISSQGLSQGGDITFRTDTGGIDTRNSILNSFSEQGTAGNVTLQAFGDILTQEVSSEGLTQGGNITLVSENGRIDTSLGSLDSFSDAGRGGNVTLQAQGDILTQIISSQGLTQKGNITLVSEKGSINTRLGSLDSFSDEGTAGNVILQAFRDIATANINTYAGKASVQGEIQGGNIAIATTQGRIDTSAGELGAFAWEGNAGNVTLEAFGDISTGVIGAYTLGQGTFQGGNIQIISHTGTLATNRGNLQAEASIPANADVASEAIASIFKRENANLDTYSLAGRGGNVLLQAPNGIITSHISSFGAIDAGSVTLFSSQGNIQTGVLFSFAEAGKGGAIAVNAPQGNLNIHHIATYVSANSLLGEGGNITLNGLGNLTLNNIASFGNLDSGDVTIRAGNLTTGTIQTLAPTGVSGNISLNTLPTLRGDIRTANITTAGGTGAGNIRIVAPDGSIITGDITSDGGTGRGGDISLDAKNDIIAGTITSTGQLGGGTVSLNSEMGSISTGEITMGNLAIGSRVGMDAIAQIEEARTAQFTAHFGPELLSSSLTTASPREALGAIAQSTGIQSAVIYVTLTDDQIELVMFTPTGEPLRKVVPQVSRQQVLETARKFYIEITDPRRRFFTAYLPLSQQLYQWLIAPLQIELQAAGIDTLLFSMDSGLRSLPIAALHDGNQFLIEQYSLSMIPSLSLMDTRYQPLNNAQVLAMGASEFNSLPPLLSVPLEISTITGEVWQGKAFLNSEFTQDNLIKQRQNHPYSIIHLATHADFKPGALNQSYIQLWGDGKITLDRLRQLGFQNPPVELLVLSACRTAFGDEQAELGFAGLAIQAGAKSALASLWYVSDEGTLALMTEFYNQLKQSKIKAEGLRQAQLSLLQEDTRIQNGQLRRSGTRGDLPLPPELAELDNQNLNHPYYWAGFTLIGSPW